MFNKSFIFLGLLILCLTVGSIILAAPDSTAGGLSIPWWTTDSGGGTSSSGQFTLSGTAGQPDAAFMTGSSYTLTSGFWNGRVGNIGGGPNTFQYLPYIAK